MSSSRTSRTLGDKLVENLCLQGPDELAVESMTYGLLNEVFAGYPVERLRQLIRCTNPEGVKAAAWILSEIGYRAEPLLDDVVELLAHDLAYVRFFAIDAVLTATPGGEGPPIANAIALLTDIDGAVRWKVLRLLTQATGNQLRSASRYMPTKQLAELTIWLSDTDLDPVDSDEIIARLEDTDRLVRLFAAAASARCVHGNASSLERAAAVSDDEVRSFAEGELRAFYRRAHRRA